MVSRTESSDFKEFRIRVFFQKIGRGFFNCFNHFCPVVIGILHKSVKFFSLSARSDRDFFPYHLIQFEKISCLFAFNFVCRHRAGLVNPDDIRNNLAVFRHCRGKTDYTALSCVAVGHYPYLTALKNRVVNYRLNLIYNIFFRILCKNLCRCVFSLYFKHCCFLFYFVCLFIIIFLIIIQ